MFLVQLLLPLYENTGQRIPPALFAQVRDELTDRFGGVTAFLRSPAHGTWKEAGGSVELDEVVMCEVMVEAVDRSWWSQYRHMLENRFGQRELIVRAIALERL